MTQPAGTEIEYTTLFNEAFEQIQEGIRQAVDAFNHLVDHVRKWAGLLGPAAVLWIRHNLGNVRHALETILEKVRYAVDHQTPVLSLISTSFRWIDMVKTPVSELSSKIIDPAEENFRKWSGDAASAYNAKAAVQKGAVDDSVVKAEFISQWLFKIATANVDFAVALSKIVTDLASRLIATSGDVVSVLGIPFAIDGLSKSAGTILKDLLDTQVNIGQRFVDALGNVRDLNAQVGDHSKLPNGQWPAAVRG